MPGGSCHSCSKPIRPRGSSGLCLSCFNAARRKHQPRNCTRCGTPVNAQQNKTGHCRTCALLVGAEQFRADPERFEAAKRKFSAVGRKNFRDPENRARQQASRAATAERRWAERLRQFPPKYHADLLRLARHKGAGPAMEKMRRRVRKDYEAEQKRLAQLSPFERQMEALRNGARLIEKPDLRKKEQERTLGGVSGGMIW